MMMMITVIVKIKELLLNFLRSENDYVEVSRFTYLLPSYFKIASLIS